MISALGLDLLSYKYFSGSNLYTSMISEIFYVDLRWKLVLPGNPGGR